ncbi:serine/threonine protein kinase [Merismopedia glauca]|nr:protein kinase [Merismopedia glauca]
MDANFLITYQIQATLAENKYTNRYTYLCQNETNTPVIVKEFKFGENKSWEPYLLVEQEIRILQSLSHSKIPQFIDRFETDCSVCFVQQYIAGQPIINLRDEQLVIKMLLEVLDILIYLQSKNIIHGDIKPENILIYQDEFYLVDFGLTKLLKADKSSTVIGGTTDYMPPEVRLGRGLNLTSDLYSLGMTALRLLSPKSTLLNYDLSPNFYGISNKLRPWLEKTLQPDPAKRYRDAVFAKEALENIPSPLPSVLPPSQNSSVTQPIKTNAVEKGNWLEEHPMTARSLTGIGMGVVMLFGINHFVTPASLVSALKDLGLAEIPQIQMFALSIAIALRIPPLVGISINLTRLYQALRNE